MTAPQFPKTDLRILGFFPLAFFLAQGIHYWQIHQLGHMLWMCNVSNLLLAVGLFARHKLLIRVAVIWLIPGLFVWLIYVVPTWSHLWAGTMNAKEVFGVMSSTPVHIGGVVISLLAIRRVRMAGRVWLYAFVWYLILQLVARLFTSPDMNVNLSHRVYYSGWEQYFTAYWKFWLVLSVVVMGGCLLLDFALRRAFPPRGELI